MGISDTLLGRKNADGPRIEAIEPAAALPGGEVRIVGKSLKAPNLSRPEVVFSGVRGSIVVSSEEFVIARVPSGAHSGQVTVHTNGHQSNGRDIKVAQPIAENLHPVSNPAIDAEGNIYVTFSGTRGQKVPVSVYRIDTNYNVKPFLSDLMNATGIAFDPEGQMYVSSRYGIAFDHQQNLYVGDRTGTIWRIAKDRQMFVFATLEPSVAAYHLAFSPDGRLFVTGPTTSSFDAVVSIDPHGDVSTFYRGLGRPQGVAFDAQGNLYVAASLAGKRGIVRITPDKKASLVVAGHNIIGLAFTRTGGAVLATTTAVFYLTWGLQGLPLI